MIPLCFTRQRKNSGVGVLGSIFAGCVPLASQNPDPILVFFWSILWPNIDLILVTFLENNSKYRPHLSHFWANNYCTLKILKKCDPILVTFKLKILSQSAPNTSPSAIYILINSPVTPLANVPTRTFYRILTSALAQPIPSVQYWSRTLQPAPNFNATFWKSMYCPLLPNKFGDLTWKVAHRIIPTALSLFRMNVYNSMDCHHCTDSETLDHLLLHWPALRPFWSSIKQYITDISDGKNYTDGPNCSLWSAIKEIKRSLQDQN